jgi:hypothetical protein
MKIRLSTIAICVIALTSCLITLSLENWKKDERVVEWDVHHYYGYLPLCFIYKDLKIEKDYRYSKDVYGHDRYWIWFEKTKDNRNVIKTTMGLAYLYAPFFFLADFIAPLTDYPANGFSEPYKMSLLLSALVFLIIGLFYTRKIIEAIQPSDTLVTIVLLTLGLGTNLLAYSSSFAPMPHVYNFALIAIFIHHTIQWHTNQAFKHILWLGITLGIITIVRPTNGLIVLFFLLYQVESKSTLKYKYHLIKTHFIKLLMVVPIVFVCWLPQFLYWKLVTGSYTYYSFGDERFFFNNPQIWRGLFSFRKGWFIYTPVMLIASIGIFFLRNRWTSFKWGVGIFYALNIYIVFSWWCWWYGGSYGQRSMIDSYALMAIPLSAFVYWVLQKGRMTQRIFAVLLGFFIWLNIFQTYQFEHKSLHYDSMSMKLYFKQFGKLEPVKDFDSYLQFIDYDEAKYGGRKPSR